MVNPEFRYFISIIETFLLLTTGLSLLLSPLCIIVPFPLLLSAILFSLFLAVQLLPRRLKEDPFLRSGTPMDVPVLQQAAARHGFPEPVVRLVNSELPLLFSLPGEIYVSRQLHDHLPETSLPPLLLRQLYRSVRAGSGMRVLIGRLRQLLRTLHRFLTPRPLLHWLRPVLALFDQGLRFAATPMVSRSALLADRFALVDCGHPDRLVESLMAELAAVCRRDSQNSRPIALAEELSDISCEDVQDLLWSLNATQRDRTETVVAYLLESRATRRLLGDDGWRGMHPGERILAISRWAERQGETLSLPLRTPPRDLDSLVILEIFQHLPMLALLIALCVLNVCGPTPLLLGLSLVFLVFSFHLRDRYRNGHGRIAILATSRDLRQRSSLGRTQGIPVILKPEQLLPTSDNLPGDIQCLMVDESGHLPVSCPGLQLTRAWSCPATVELQGIFRRNPAPRLELLTLTGMAGLTIKNCHQNRIRLRLLLAALGIILIVSGIF